MNNNDSVINAIKSNNISLVTSLIAGGSVNVNARIDKQNSSALHLAAQLGHVEIVALLLDAGAHIDDVNDYHDTACHAAVRECRIDVVKLLVARNANLSLAKWRRRDANHHGDLQKERSAGDAARRCRNRRWHCAR
jgi:ankyrin repeat protein